MNLDLGIMNLFLTAETVQHIHILSFLEIMKALYSKHILPVPWAVISRLHLAFFSKYHTYCDILLRLERWHY